MMRLLIILAFCFILEAHGQSTSRGSLTHTPLAGEAAFDCTLACYDDDGTWLKKSVTHCDIYYEADGLFGYKYWMAYTPFPDADRENPCIAVSNNGRDFSTPAGLTNPIATLADAQTDGWVHWADTDILKLGSGSLVVFWIGNGDGQGLYRSTSANGTTWSARELLFADTIAGGIFLASPAAVKEADNSLTMFYHRAANPDVANQRLAYKTSSDSGATWSAETLCTYTVTGSRPHIWHLDVALVGTTYHMLGIETGTGNGRYFYGTSANKTAWTFTVNAVPLTGKEFDGSSVYRGTFWLVNASPVLWDVLISGVPKNASDDGLTGQPWRLGLWQNISLPY